MSGKFDNLFSNYQVWRDTWMNNGLHAATQTKLTFNDMIATSNARQWMPIIVEDVVREPIEPTLVIPSLLDRIAYNPAVRITLPAIGACVAADIAEGQSYPEISLNLAPGTMTMNVGKSGIAFKVSEEMRRYATFDVVNLHIRACQKALARHKESKGMDFILGMGTVLFDNRAPTDSVFGICTGRNIAGSGNGSCRMEDLLKAWSFLMMQGYIPDTILIHPLAWSMWMSDPLLQTIAKNTGRGPWFNNPNPAKTSLSWPNASQNKMGVAGGLAYVPSETTASDVPSGVGKIDQTLNAKPSVPGYFPFPLSVVVSPFAPFDTEKNTCDIMLFDSSNLGALIVDEDVSMDQWTDLSVDIEKIKLKEKYGFCVYEDGLAIGVMKHVPIVPNEIIGPVQAMITNLSALTLTTAISGL